MTATTMRARRMIITACVPIYLMLITGTASAVALAPLLLAADAISPLAAGILAPFSFCLTYAMAAALLSRLTLRAMIPGRFPRDLGHPVYGPRRLHALCWTAIYYCPPVYHAVLAIPQLKRVVFRLFGYRGSLDIALYPDTWVRDLPVLDVGDGAYLSNRATIGTNMCLTSGDVLVAPVRIGKRAMVGHMSMLGPGVVLGDDVEVSVGVGIGLNTRIGAGSRIGPCAVVHHGAQIGEGCDIGATSYIGLKAVIADHLVIPPGLVIPARTVLRTQDDVAALAPTRGATCKAMHASRAPLSRLSYAGRSDSPAMAFE